MGNSISILVHPDMKKKLSENDFIEARIFSRGMKEAERFFDRQRSTQDIMTLIRTIVRLTRPIRFFGMRFSGWKIIAMAVRLKG